MCGSVNVERLMTSCSTSLCAQFLDLLEERYVFFFLSAHHFVNLLEIMWTSFASLWCFGRNWLKNLERLLSMHSRHVHKSSNLFLFGRISALRYNTLKQGFSTQILWNSMGSITDSDLQNPSYTLLMEPLGTCFCFCPRHVG